jgi:hypothetical protein
MPDKKTTPPKPANLKNSRRSISVVIFAAPQNTAFNPGNCEQAKKIHWSQTANR